MLHSTSEASFGRTTSKVDLAATARSPKAEIESIFMPDKDIGESSIFQVLSTLNLQWCRFFHDLTVEGIENIPKNQGVMLVGFHTTHNMDIFLGVFVIYEKLGRAVRGMLHHMVYKFNPWVKYIGLVPGYRSTAEKLLAKGFITGD
jgi:1-acyl-sn-glycerol-3-phosphate acyltransferase